MVLNIDTGDGEGRGSSGRDELSVSVVLYSDLINIWGMCQNIIWNIKYIFGEMGHLIWISKSVSVIFPAPDNIWYSE